MDLPDYAPAVALLLVGVAILAVPGGTFAEPAEYRFEVSTPGEATHQPTSTVAYEDLSERSKEVFRAALDSPDGEYVVRGSENAPDDIDYVTDYYPSPGVFNVTYEGERYVMVASAPGVNILGGLVSMVVRAFGILSAATGVFALAGRWRERALAGQAAAGGTLLGVSLVAPALFGNVVVLLAMAVLTVLALGHLFVTVWAAVRGD